MVNINTVYQRVLALANKEQRGYITPQEFNLFATQAQMSIFEQYFYDLNQFLRIPGNNTTHSDMVDMLEEKISLFEISNYSISSSSLPVSLYKLQQVTWLNPVDNRSYVAEYVDKKSLTDMIGVSLLAPTDKKLVYTRSKNGITVLGKGVKSTGVSCDFIAVPKNPNWTYIVVDEKALYNPDPNAGYLDFELHKSEQTELVNRILQLAGITLKDPSLYQTALAEENKTIQQQKA